MSQKVYDLEERLINFAVQIINVSESLSSTSWGKTLAKQLERSGTAPALNYGEAQSAESPKDFLHKMRICLKELREMQITLKIVDRKPATQQIQLDSALDECGQLVAIFTASITTAQRTRK